MRIKESRVADLEIDGMLAFRVPLGQQRTLVPDATLERAFSASLRHFQPVCLYGIKEGRIFLWSDLQPVLNHSEAHVINEDRSGRHSSPQGQRHSERRSQEQKEARAPSSGWTRAKD